MWIFQTTKDLTVSAAMHVTLAGGASASGNPDVAALQVGLRARGLYAGTVDGELGPGTQKALRRFQRRSGLAGEPREAPAQK